MLVLTRKKNQEIMIGEDIKITILEITEGIVKIGIEAPKEFTVLRSELYKAVLKENISASTVDIKAANDIKNLFP